MWARYIYNGNNYKDSLYLRYSQKTVKVMRHILVLTPETNMRSMLVVDVNGDCW